MEDAAGQVSTSELDKHIRSHSSNKLSCTYDRKKGRITVAQITVEPGEVVLDEKRLAHAVEPSADDNWLYAKLLEWHAADQWELQAMWTWTACCMILTAEETLEYAASEDPSEQALAALPLHRHTNDIRRKLLTLFSPPITAKSVSVDILSCHKRLTRLLKDESRGRPLSKKVITAIEPKLLQRYANTWIFNCFEGTGEPLSFVTYFAPAFSSHSCLPNSLWHTDDDTFTLVARKFIEKGEEISFTYTSDGHLLEPTLDRRKDLEVTKYFTCRCERCTFPSDLSRGFRCQSCHKGQWFMATEEPLGEDEEIADVCEWLDLERHHDVEDEDIREYLLTIEIPELYRVIDHCRLDGQLTAYVRDHVKPLRCTHCGLMASKREFDRAKVLESLLSMISAKDDGEERRLSDSVTDFWSQSTDEKALSPPTSAEEWWRAISFYRRLLPSLLRYVGNNCVLTQILEWRKMQLSEEDNLLSLELAVVYAEARQIMVTQMCPIYTGFTAWASADVVDLLSRIHCISAVPQPRRDPRIAIHRRIAGEIAQTIFGQSSFTNDIVDTMEIASNRMSEKDRAAQGAPA